MSMCNNRRERRQKSFSHQVILCTVWKILEYLYCMKKGHFTVVLSWLIGVSLLGRLALGRAGCLLQIQRWNVLLFHFCIIFIYDIMWLHGRKQSKKHHWKPILFLNFVHDVITHFLEGKKPQPNSKPKNLKIKQNTLKCFFWCVSGGVMRV